MFFKPQSLSRMAHLGALLIVAAAGLIGTAAGCATSSSQHAQTQPAVETDSRRQPDIRFGSFDASGFHESSPIVLKAGNYYGWQMVTDDGDQIYRWREQLTLPSRATWMIDGVDADKAAQGNAPTPEHRHVDVIDDGRSAIRTGQSHPVRGLINQGWGVIDGDPAGEYVATIQVDGYKPKTFHVMFVRP